MALVSLVREVIHAAQQIKLELQKHICLSTEQCVASQRLRDYSPFKIEQQPDGCAEKPGIVDY